MIRAETHSDDRHVKIDFDATAYIEGLPDAGILDLARIDWGGDYTADDVARHYDATTTKPLFDYLGTHPTMGRDTVGFECYVDADDALTWLRENRPHLVDAIEQL